MKRMLSKFFVLFFIAFSFGLAFAGPTAGAKDILKEACDGQASGSATCQSTSTDNPLTGKDGTLYKISRIVASIAGVVAVIIIVVSGLMYVTAAGDTQKIATAKNALLGAIIGLVIIAIAQSIITFVVSRL